MDPTYTCSRHVEYVGPPTSTSHAYRATDAKHKIIVACIVCSCMYDTCYMAEPFVKQIPTKLTYACIHGVIHTVYINMYKYNV